MQHYAISYICNHCDLRIRTENKLTWASLLLFWAEYAGGTASFGACYFPFSRDAPFLSSMFVECNSAKSDAPDIS